MNAKVENQIARMKNQTVGVEVEMNSITREQAARTVAKFFGTTAWNAAREYGYCSWACKDTDGRVWKFQKDVSIAGPDSEKCEMVTPILTYSDMDTLQEIIRILRKAGAKSDATRGCGVHIHIGANGHTPKTLRNLANIMASHESLLTDALALDRNRVARYCRTVDPDFLRELNRKKPTTMARFADIWYTSQNANFGRTQHYNGSRYENYYLTGSQQMKLMAKAKESLAGRVSILELQGLSMREINGIGFNRHFVPTDEYITAREQELKPYENIWQIIHRGSYPELYVTEREWVDFYSSYVRTYLERDIKDEIEIRDEITFTRFLTAVAARTGQLLNYANISEEVGVTQATIKNWVSVLEKTGIVYILEPYYSSHLTRAIKTPKIYFRDTGLACYLSRWNNYEALESSAVAGNMFETFVVNEIIKSFINEGLEYKFSVFYYRGKDKKKTKQNGETIETENEIDFIIEENGVLYPIEIKKSAKPTKSMGDAFNVLDKDVDKQRGLGVILCLYDEKLYLKDDLVVLPIEYL